MDDDVDANNPPDVADVQTLAPRQLFDTVADAFLFAELMRAPDPEVAVLRAVRERALDPHFAFTQAGGNLVNWAAEHGHLELLRALVLEYRVDVRQLDQTGHTALLGALNCRYLEKERQPPRVDAALFLINEAPSVDINARTSEGETALMLAAGAGAVEVLRALVAKGVDVDAKDKRSRSAVDHAFACKQEEAAIYLLGRGTRLWWGIIL